MEFVIGDGKLISKARKSDDLPLEPTFQDGFAAASRTYFTFTRDEHGNITGFTVSTCGVRKVLYNKIDQ